MNEELRMQRVREYGSFLFCPMRNTDCFYRETDKECGREGGCILDDPEHQALQRTIEENRKKHSEDNRKEEKAEFVPPSRTTRQGKMWREILKKEAMAAALYKRNKPKVADGLLMEALQMRRELKQEGNQKT